MERTEFEYEHFRGNNTKISIEDVVKRLIHINIYYTLNEDNANAFFAKNEKYMQDLYAAGKVTIQSKTLMYTARLVKTGNDEDILELCTAPGGKFVYMSILFNILKLLGVLKYDYHNSIYDYL